jgi:hypothetical protein
MAGTADSFPPSFLVKGDTVLTESEVQRSFRKLFVQDGEIAKEAFDKAEALLEELRPESPLRHRLQREIQELRDIHGVQAP